MTLLQMNAYSNNSPEILYKNIVINFSPIWWGNKGLTIFFLGAGLDATFLATFFLTADLAGLVVFFAILFF